jgi:hypothetical protein
VTTPTQPDPPQEGRSTPPAQAVPPVQGDEQGDEQREREQREQREREQREQGGDDD